MQVVYEEVLKILFTFRDVIGSFQFTTHPYACRDILDKAVQNIHMGFAELTWEPWEPCDLLDHQPTCSYVLANKST